MMLTAITNIVISMVVAREGQVTFFSSRLTCCRYTVGITIDMVLYQKR